MAKKSKREKRIAKREKEFFAGGIERPLSKDDAIAYLAKVGADPPWI